MGKFIGVEKYNPEYDHDSYTKEDAWHTNYSMHIGEGCSHEQAIKMEDEER